LQMYILEDRGEPKRLYADCLGSLECKIADYSVYSDYKGKDWLHIYIKKEDRYLLLPFYRLGSGQEYLEYLAVLTEK
jgi:hypothetical protein